MRTVTVTREEAVKSKTQIAQEVAYRLVRELTEDLYEQYEIGNHYPTVMRNRQDAYHRTFNGNKHQIIFGYYLVDHFLAEGYYDYPTIHNQIQELRGRQPQGIEAAYWLAIHEFAHVLQVEAGGRYYGQQHNGVFIEKFNELVTLFPFSEVAEKFLSVMERRVLGVA